MCSFYSDKGLELVIQETDICQIWGVLMFDMLNGMYLEKMCICVCVCVFYALFFSGSVVSQ